MLDILKSEKYRTILIITILIWLFALISFGVRSFIMPSVYKTTQNLNQLFEERNKREQEYRLQRIKESKQQDKAFDDYRDRFSRYVDHSIAEGFKNMGWEVDEDDRIIGLKKSKNDR